MKIADIRKRSPEELAKGIRDLKVQVWKARVNNRAGLLTNTASIKATRKDIARSFTVLSQAKLSQANPSKAKAGVAVSVAPKAASKTTAKKASAPRKAAGKAQKTQGAKA